MVFAVVKTAGKTISDSFLQINEYINGGYDRNYDGL